MRLIKGSVRRALSRLGNAIVSSTQVQEALGEIRNSIAEIRNSIAALQRELAETKSGVSALQGESGENLSNVVVMRQELREALELVRDQAPNDRASRESARPPLSPTSNRIFALPRQLERHAAHLCANSYEANLESAARKLARHYLKMADLIALHWLSNGHFPEDPYPEDDLTIAYAKHIAAFVPEADYESESEPDSLPWRSFWSDPQCMRFLVFGNGTAANCGMSRHKCEHEVYNFDAFRFRCTHASDPLAGATGNSGSVWSLLGDQLIEHGVTQRVLFVPLAFAGSQIMDWIPGGSRHGRTTLALSRLRKGLVSPMLPFSAVLWQPGGASELSSRAYRLHCHDIIADLRANGVLAPIFVAGANEIEHRNAREQVISPDPASGIFDGPDLDKIRFGPAAGRITDRVLVDAERAAQLWLTLLSAYSPLLMCPNS